MLMKYPGGKARVAKQLLQLVPSDFSEYREPFAGNAPFLWHLPASMPRWINDIDEDVYRYYIALRDDPSFIARFQSLRKSCDCDEATLQEFDRQKQRLVFDDDPVAYLFLRRLARRQIVNRNRTDLASPAYPLLETGVASVTREKMEQARSILQGVRITCGDYASLLTAAAENCFLFIDCPYYVFDYGYPIYQHPFSIDDHVTLRDRLASLDPVTHRFLATIGECELTHDLYVADGRFHIQYLDIPYNMTSNRRRRSGRELIVTNYPPPTRDSLGSRLFQMSSDDAELEPSSMLSVASKIGPKDEVLAFNLPVEKTCCSPNSGESQIASPGCRSVCYVNKMTQGRPGVVRRAEQNFKIANRPDFSELMTAAILRSGVRHFKIHVMGDFFDVEYINAWTRVVQNCSDVLFWAYTRAWRREDFLPALTKLAALPNIRLHLSFDRTMPIPPRIPNADFAYLSLDDSDAPPVHCRIVFRSSVERKFIPLTVLGGSRICPHEDGKPSGPVDCLSCRICLPQSEVEDRAGHDGCPSTFITMAASDASQIES